MRVCNKRNKQVNFPESPISNPKHSGALRQKDLNLMSKLSDNLKDTSLSSISSIGMTPCDSWVIFTYIV